MNSLTCIIVYNIFYLVEFFDFESLMSQIIQITCTQGRGGEVVLVASYLNLRNATTSNNSKTLYKSMIWTYKRTKISLQVSPFPSFPLPLPLVSLCISGDLLSAKQATSTNQFQIL